MTDKDSYFAEIAWSTNENILYLKDNNKIKKIFFDAENTVVEEVSDFKDIELNNYYGRFGRGSWWGNDDCDD